MTRDQLAEAALFRALGLSWRKIAIWYELPPSTVMDRVNKFVREGGAHG